MIHWLSTAFSTYVLHTEHNNGYQWWSGPGGDLAYCALVYSLWRKHNCYERWCPRVGTHRSQLDAHIRCRRHHERHKAGTPYQDAKHLDSR